jgi:hypothetical protein
MTSQRPEDPTVTAEWEAEKHHDRLTAELATVREERDRYRAHSETLNAVGYRVAHALAWDAPAAEAYTSDVLADVDRLIALVAACSCGKSPMTYEGPEPDCPVHGAVRAYNEATAEVSRLQAELHTAQGVTVTYRLIDRFGGHPVTVAERGRNSVRIHDPEAPNGGAVAEIPDSWIVEVRSPTAVEQLDALREGIRTLRDAIRDGGRIGIEDAQAALVALLDRTSITGE